MMNDSPTLALTRALIERPSVTPADEGCLDLIAQRLVPLGFHCQSLPFEDVSNLWAVYGNEGPLFVFAGHTDVVPTGPLEQWQSPPFEPTLRDGKLYGRGAADMKGSLAAMVVACENFLAGNPHPKGRIGFLLTSDEEGLAKHGTRAVMDYLRQQGETIAWCLVGEPTCVDRLGDTIKNGRRGSLNCRLTVHGHQGHIAYPQLADNPIHGVAPALTELVNTVWDEGNEFFPPTSFQVSNINAGTGATNVIPGTLAVIANFRFSTEVTDDQLRQRTEGILSKHNLRYDIEWQLSGQPFLTERGKLVSALSEAIRKETGKAPELSTSGGTSDGRFIAPSGAQVVEFGPINATIHKVNECVNTADLEQLTRIYAKCLAGLLENQ